MHGGEGSAVAGVQGVGLFLDLGVASGPVAGVANAAVKLIRTFVFALFDFIDFSRGQERLLRRQFDADIVQACPVLGAYLITEAETSTLMAFLSGGTLPANWMDEVERLKDEIDVVVRLANACILKSPFMLKGYTQAYGEDKTAEFDLKGEHMLDFRTRKLVKRYLFEARKILMRDPKGLRFLGRHLRNTLGL